jgi:hypothetical protein
VNRSTIDRTKMQCINFNTLSFYDMYQPDVMISQSCSKQDEPEIYVIDPEGATSRVNAAADTEMDIDHKNFSDQPMLEPDELRTQRVDYSNREEVAAFERMFSEAVASESKVGNRCKLVDLFHSGTRQQHEKL